MHCNLKINWLFQNAHTHTDTHTPRFIRFCNKHNQWEACATFHTATNDPWCVCGSVSGGECVIDPVHACRCLMLSMEIGPDSSAYCIMAGEPKVACNQIWGFYSSDWWRNHGALCLLTPWVLGDSMLHPLLCGECVCVCVNMFHK